MNTLLNLSLVDLLPKGFIVRWAAPYIAGNDAQSAIRLGQELFKAEHFCGTLDMLGEDVRQEEQCGFFTDDYLNIIDKLAAGKPLGVLPRERLSISIKPSMFSAVTPGAVGDKAALDRAFDRIMSIVDRAFRSDINVTIEAESHYWTNFQLESYFALINAGYSNVGTVLQTKLFRTENDLKRFDERTRVRLVLGICKEPSTIAYTKKSEMKARLIRYSEQLFNNGAYVEMATHDEDYLAQFFAYVIAPQAISPSRFETQFLLGVPLYKLQRALVSGSYFSDCLSKLECAQENSGIRAHLEKLAVSGVLVRIYLPFGSDEVAGPYCKRRLRDNPNLLFYGIKNLCARLGSD